MVGNACCAGCRNSVDGRDDGRSHELGAVNGCFAGWAGGLGRAALIRGSVGAGIGVGIGARIGARA